jgi:NhaP-type Na+/H+ or K+/H+ antiporter/mannitol/fructose-specific phosphotransferase system IIA component (Ntr-type)
MEDLRHEMMMSIVTAIGAGIILISISRRFNLPTIVLLLAGGILLGHEVLGIVEPKSLGQGLPVIVSLAVGLILFEGGLTLDVAGYRTAPALIPRLLTIGVLITWISTALIIKTLFRTDLSFSFLCASLVTVTGPTVIAPLLRRLRLNTNLHQILHWEGVLVDPIGVFLAILCFEFMVDRSGGTAIALFVLRFALGIGIGAVGGWSIFQFIRRKLVSEDMINVFAFAGAVLIFGFAESFIAESGLLAVTVAGFVLGLNRPVEIKQIRQFKAEITDLLIGMLFILLSARLDFDQFRHFGLTGAALVAAVLLVVRPLNILLCSWNLSMTWPEKIFLGWVAPRGIVAASMASLFAIDLERAGLVGDPRFIETFVYSVIVTTVFLQGLSAGPIARFLGLRRAEPTGWLIVGAHPFARAIANFISHKMGFAVTLVDSNAKLVGKAKDDGLIAISADVLDPHITDRQEFQGVGHLIGLTDNEELNELVCQRWADRLGRSNVYRWRSSLPENPEQQGPGKIIWPQLPRPSLLSAELARGEASTIQASKRAASDSPTMTVLITSRDKKMIIDPQPGKDDPAKQDAAKNDAAEFGDTLYLRREADYLVRSLHPRLVARVNVKDVSELLTKMVDIVVRHMPTVPRDHTIRELLEREKAFPTALGHAVAIPHTYCKQLESRVCAVAQIPGGVDFGAVDGEPVKLAFLLLSPPGDPEGHLATLAEIARVVLDAPTRDRLMTEQDPGQLLDVVRQFNPLRPVKSLAAKNK